MSVPNIRDIFRRGERYRIGRRLGGSVFRYRHGKKRSILSVRRVPRSFRPLTLLVILVAALVIQLFAGRPDAYVSALTPEIEKLIGSQSYPLYATNLVEDFETRTFEFNKGYQAGANTLGFSSGPKFSGAFPMDASEGITVRDPFSDTSIKLIPQFEMQRGRKDGSRVVYPLEEYDGIKVITLTAAGYKEDIVLNSYQKNNIDFSYVLELPEHTEARLEPNGSIGIYGVADALLGAVSTGTEQDAQLLEKARQNQAKDNLLFTLPEPYVVESTTKDTAVGTYYSLEGNILTTHVRGLANARHFPLTIDPSVYVDTAIKLSRGNNETNIDFDTSNELIQKGATTGGRFADWQNTMALDNNHWNVGTAVANGYIYSIGGGLADDSMYMTPGETEFVVPAGVTSISLKAWGAGGGGGGASEDGNGGAGGGGGYAAATITVTPGEVLTLRIGEGGKGGRYTAPDDVIVGDGGGGGGYSGVFRSSTALLVAGGGGGGGGDNGSGNGTDGGAGGAGGGSSGVAGTGDGATTGGGAGTSSAGGAAGATSTTGGTAGASLQGGNGASNRDARGDASYGGGGAGGKGDTGTLAADRDPGGGGGGGGYYGGGGGGAANGDTLGGGGGGGGSGYVTGTSTTNTAGSGTTPGNSGDGDRNGAGVGGAGGVETSGEPAAGSEGADGLILVTVTSNESSGTKDVWWAKIDPVSQEITSPNPGNGNCTQWCTSTAYELPTARVGASVVAYNGFLYVIGGKNTVGGTRQKTVYIAKLGANGEPSLWHPTDSNPDNWVFWYDSNTQDITTATAYGSAVAYNNRLYYIGGNTSASTGGVTTIEYTDLEPNGTIAGWTSTGMTALPTAMHNHATLVYNDYLYVLGGNSSGTLQTAVRYIPLKSDGTMDGSWLTTTSLDTARMSWGGKFAAIFGGFIYIAGGCSAVDAQGECTAVQDDVRLNSINADGSLTKWTSILDVTNERIGHGLEAWNGALYTIGGCRQQNTSSGACTWGATQNVYGAVNQDGDASTVRNSVFSGTAPCSGASPTNCSLPPEGDNNGTGGNMSGGAVINNGIIYYFGGCTAVGNGSICYTGASAKATDNIYYAAIGDDGQLEQVASGACTGSGVQYYGNWCVDNSNTLPSKLAGMGVALFDNTVYLIGGTDGTTFGANLYHMTLDSDGSIGTWSTQTFTDLDLGTARGYMYAFTRANPSSAGTYPGNLFVLGGCAPDPITTDGVDCGDTQFTEVYKCNITTSGALETADANDCTTSGQLQIDSEAGAGNQGLGVMAGTVYANYIYLIGGQSPSESARGEIMYAKIDDSNNIVAASGSTWQTSANEISPVRRRGAAFGYNGYLYALAGYNAGETLNDLLYAKINVADGSIGVFSESDVTVLPRWDLQAVVSNGFVLTLGGCSTGVPPQDCQTMQRTVQTFQLYNNYSGSPSSYSAGANLFTTDRIGASSTVLNDKLYIAGGCTSATDCTTVTADVQYTTISAAGSLGTWATFGDMPAGRAWGQLEEAGGSLYYVGGQDSAGDEKSDVFYVTPLASGAASTDEIEHYSAKRVTELTSSTTGWQSVTGTADTGTTSGTNGWIDSTNFTAGERYLIMVWGGHTTDDSSSRSGLRVKHGSTVFDESVDIIESDRVGTNRKKTYTWFTVWTATSGEDLEVEAFFENNGGSTLYVEDITLIAINAEDLITDGDLQYDIDTTGGTLTTTPTAKASLSWTPNHDNDDWWVMSYAQGDTVDINSDFFEGQLDVNGTVRSFFQIEGEDVDDTPVFQLGWTQQFTKASTTVDLELSESAAEMEWDAAGVFALRLNRFETFATDANSTASTLTQSTFTEAAAIDPNLSTAGDFLAVGGVTMDHAGAGASQVRMQLGGSDVTDLQAANEYDDTDDSPASQAELRINESTGTKDFDWDVYHSSAGPVDMDERWMVGFSMKETTWQFASNGLPADRTKFSAVSWNDRIYVTGGLDDAASETNTVYYSPDLSSGGNITSAWTSDTDTFDVARSGMTTVAYANNLYIFGGHDGSNYLNDAQFTQINSDGSIDAWTFTTSLPEPIRQADGFAANGYLYLIGGRTADTTCASNTWVTPISANTTIASGNNPTGVGAWYETIEGYTGDRYGASVSYHNGKAYVLGGGCGATLTYTDANRVVQTTAQSQPQVARYSYFIDADTDVFPTKWLVNGLDNDIGARWFMDYRSSTDANNAWGQATDFGAITLGTVNTYTPLDDLGADTSFARYYYMQLDIDSSQAYGFPDDVSRGPTIDDLTLFFTADPSKRLRHGKTFIQGLQQPLDSPPPD